MKILLEDRVIAGGFSFSAKTEVISIPKSVDELSEAHQSLFKEYALLCREVYVAKSNAATAAANGARVNALLVKREAVAAAKILCIRKHTEEVFNDMWAEFTIENDKFSREKKAAAKLISRQIAKDTARPKKSTEMDAVEDGASFVSETEDPYEL